MKKIQKPETTDYLLLVDDGNGVYSDQREIKMSSPSKIWCKMMRYDGVKA